METSSIKVFISYSHQDEELQTKIAKQLRILGVSVWVDRMILPGAKWTDEIERELEAADIILLLVSDDFLTSDFVTQHEIPRALERQRAGTAKVVPVLARPCPWGGGRRFARRRRGSRPTAAGCPAPMRGRAPTPPSGT